MLLYKVSMHYQQAFSAQVITHSKNISRYSNYKQNTLIARSVNMKYCEITRIVLSDIFDKIFRIIFYSIKFSTLANNC